MERTDQEEQQNQMNTGKFAGKVIKKQKQVTTTKLTIKPSDQSKAAQWAFSSSVGENEIQKICEEKWMRTFQNEVNLNVQEAW